MESPRADLDEIAARLCDDVGRGESVSAVLSTLALRHRLWTIELVKCLRLAFGLSLAQASPVGGWLPDGSGEITHERLDQFIDDARRVAPDAETLFGGGVA